LFVRAGFENGRWYTGQMARKRSLWIKVSPHSGSVMVRDELIPCNETALHGIAVLRMFGFDLRCEVRAIAGMRDKTETEIN
jgi:hypothetical protein